ncbi:MAG TPA: type IV toxin-antitoxin system AbiEi family antitoxin domain-containing protein [Myxococcota bacterium]|jgi:predicted transcriptional regulator of viral defense system|nr:type IV toxin-antitoxin system AbiEi family antitoxin domain-containing protein [Myxococcota bacterium]HNH45824.1 type IV toxin-antitoxin system AbiEi family antitoxin domain-containing protein [Myxococcota bacterium]
MVPERPTRPDWDRLFEVASAQEGLFTAKQAAEAGYSAQLLVHHLHAGRIIRVRHGIYRLVHYPAGDHEDLVALWLWSGGAGVLSHETALALHGLSDVLPTKVHLTVPAEWAKRRLRVPPGLLLHYAELPAEACTWFGATPTTTLARTLNDCATGGLSPELLGQAARQALRRGLVVKAQLGEVAEALAPFGGIAA